MKDKTTQSYHNRGTNQSPLFSSGECHNLLGFYQHDSFGFRNTKECSIDILTYRQSKTYSHKMTQKTDHYSLFHPTPC